MVFSKWKRKGYNKKYVSIKKSENPASKYIIKAEAQPLK